MSFRYPYEYVEESILKMQIHGFSMQDIVACYKAIVSEDEQAIDFWRMRIIHYSPKGNLCDHDWHNVFAGFDSRKSVHGEFIMELLSQGGKVWKE